MAMISTKFLTINNEPQLLICLDVTKRLVGKEFYEYLTSGNTNSCRTLSLNNIPIKIIWPLVGPWSSSWKGIFEQISFHVWVHLVCGRLSEEMIEDHRRQETCYILHILMSIFWQFEKETVLKSDSDKCEKINKSFDCKTNRAISQLNLLVLKILEWRVALM